MARTLKQIIEDWESKRMVNVGTAAQAKAGRPVSPLMARQLAKAFGADDQEAEEVAAYFASMKPDATDAAS
jgi:hypothetical protein